MKKQIFTIFLFFIGITVWAQNGVITGVVNDGEMNDVLPFANVLVKEINKGVMTDFEGKYSVELEPGTYTLVFSFVGYQTQEITGIEVKGNQEKIVNVILNAAASQLDEVVITTTARRNTEASVLNLQKKSVNLFDGLSLEAVKKTGASNVASAVKSVPGVSLQDGKFVYVRGLGDRYTKSTLNGMDIPGLDPDRNTVQLDIFPTNLIENVIVYKSLTADLPADFTGGAVDIVTKDFSAREEYNFTFGMGYNPDMHFNDKFLQEDASGTDFLGFDDGQRDDPFALGITTPQPFENDPRLTEITRSFNPVMAAEEETSLMNFNFGFNTSNQFNLKGDNKLGYIASLGYRNEVIHYDDFTQNFLFKPQQLDEFDLVPNRLQKGRLSKQSTVLSGLAGLTYKTDFSKYKLILMHIQNGEKRAGKFDQESFITNAATFLSDNLEYTERFISNALITGKHSFNQDSKFEFDWKVNAALSSVDDKDVRSTLFEFDDGNFIIRPSIGEPRRIWRDLDETNISSKANFEYNHNLFDKNAKLKFGGAQVYKQRDFAINQYVIRIQGIPAEPFDGDPNRLLIEQNLWTPDNSGGTYLFNTFEPANVYESASTVFAAYASEELKVTENLKAILGLRFEKFDLNYTGQNTLGDELIDARLLDEADLFPSANLIYAVNDNTNLRLSYARSTARPSFKEASNAQIFDPITNITFNGNLDIKPTYVDNFDIRYEIFSDEGGLIALSGFYKDFTDPIELSIFGLQAINDVQPRNLGSAQVYGAEFEFRKNLSFVTATLEKFSLNTNISIIESEQTMNEAEFQGRLSAVRDGENIDNKRQLQGQSPFLINAGLTYDDNYKGIQAGFYYNVQGKTLEIVGIGQVADVFSEPFHSLNFNGSKKFGKDFNKSISLGVDNLLNDKRQSFYQSFGTEDTLYSNFSPGLEISLKYTYKF